ncbi:hypothetical protein MKEN_00542600 [Mycena kentingensis (nom. inval.)]|nr:hypothetical protein MKEN_00542600 [Mycena kentingensis (nom. inval.)]
MKLSYTFILLAALLTDSFMTLAAPVDVAPRADAVVKTAKKTVAPAAKKATTSKVGAATTNTKAKVVTSPGVAAAGKKSLKSGAAGTKNTTAIATGNKKSVVGAKGASNTTISDSATACAIRRKSKPIKKTGAAGTLARRAISRTQFHATCKNFAASIERRIEDPAKTFKLKAQRKWPDEFSITGGFYLTPDETNAQIFGGVFLAPRCVNEGGVVIMRLELNREGLAIKEVAGSDAEKIHKRTRTFGLQIAQFLAANPAPELDDFGIASDDDDSATPGANNGPPVPSAAQLQRALTTDGVFSATPANEAKIRNIITDLLAQDVIAGAVPLHPKQVQSMASAAQLGMPQLEDPFEQVVLLTDKAVSQLEVINIEPLPACILEPTEKILAATAEFNARKAKAEAAKKAAEAGAA